MRLDPAHMPSGWAQGRAPDAPTPVSLARALRAKGHAPANSPADLVLQAAQPWSRDTHALFPAAARARVRSGLAMG